MQLAELPREVIHDRGVTLRRVLADLPEPLLAALISGLEVHGDELRCRRRLYPSEHTSCAAGAMIRQLAPEEFEGGHLHFLLHHRWRRSVSSYGGRLATGMHATMLESTFDRSVYVALKVRPDASERDASRLVGRWFLEEASRELQLRDDRRAAGLPPIVDWRARRLRRWGEGMERRLPVRKLRLVGTRLDARGLPRGLVPSGEPRDAPERRDALAAA